MQGVGHADDDGHAVRFAWMPGRHTLEGGQYKFVELRVERLGQTHIGDTPIDAYEEAHLHVALHLRLYQVGGIGYVAFHPFRQFLQ